MSSTTATAADMDHSPRVVLERSHGDKPARVGHLIVLQTTLETCCFCDERQNHNRNSDSALCANIYLNWKCSR
ncbi:hypothetical protein RRG08_041176 [Elysia crispata]|uniref:Uncharacterized protein n=1 Tax=Elysia crispata TaxID=231223 RepID=A0AAE1CPB6_9GAST|nr:hypothetical protein RRG08_041176 [Elysia crispata]